MVKRHHHAIEKLIILHFYLLNLILIIFFHLFGQVKSLLCVGECSPRVKQTVANDKCLEGLPLHYI